MGVGRDGHCLVRIEWRPSGWSVCLPVLIFSCTVKSRSSHLGGPRKSTVKRLWWWWWWCGVCWTTCWLYHCFVRHPTADLQISILHVKVAVGNAEGLLYITVCGSSPKVHIQGGPVKSQLRHTRCSYVSWAAKQIDMGRSIYLTRTSSGPQWCLITDFYLAHPLFRCLCHPQCNARAYEQT